MLILMTAAAFLVIGYAVTARLLPALREGAPGPLERATYVALIATTLWLATTWILALTRTLTAAALGIRAIILVVIAVPLLVRAGRTFRSRIGGSEVTGLLPLVPLFAVVAFALFRGAVLPPVSHDALAYHLPKAVLFARAEGFRYLSELDPRQASIPANYEMLLAEIIALDGRDDWTEAPSTVFYVLFVLASAAVTERWWRNRHATLAVAIACAGIPVALLHSAAHKNDLMTAFFAVAAILAASRWLAQREIATLTLLIVAIGCGVGTKPQVAMLALALAAAIVVPVLRTLRLRVLAGLVVFGIVAFLLLGGATYVLNVARDNSVVGEIDAAQGSVIQYGDWRNLWEGPYVLLAGPFMPREDALVVPWKPGHPWFWQRYELYFSHLGIPFAVCALAAPFAVGRLRRRLAGRESIVVTAAAVVAFVLMLPVVFKPHGLYAISLPRYALFIAPVVFGWTIAPLTARSKRAGAAVVLLLVASFVVYAADSIQNDDFAPLSYVSEAYAHPGTREVPFHSGRAASVVDRMAGPDDKIAFDAGYASWIHPAFGAELSRPVYFIPPGAGQPSIPDDARWVVVDRAWNIFWGEAEERDLSEARLYLRRGKPAPEDLRVRRFLIGDHRFRIAYLQLGTNQVVFERVR